MSIENLRTFAAARIAEAKARLEAEGEASDKVCAEVRAWCKVVEAGRLVAFACAKSMEAARAEAEAWERIAEVIS
jgi:hypothetical protein